jgi:hypothetical protein
MQLRLNTSINAIDSPVDSESAKLLQRAESSQLIPVHAETHMIL